MVKATAAQGAHLWWAIFSLQLCQCPRLYARDGKNHWGWKGCSLLMQKHREIFWGFLLSFLSSHPTLTHKICLTHWWQNDWGIVGTSSLLGWKGYISVCQLIALCLQLHNVLEKKIINLKSVRPPFIFVTMWAMLLEAGYMLDWILQGQYLLLWGVVNILTEVFCFNKKCDRI